MTDEKDPANAERLRISIEKIDRAVALLDAKTDADGRIIDEGGLEPGDERFLVRGTGSNIRGLNKFMTSRFGVEAPADLVHMQKKFNGLVVDSEPDPLSWSDSNLWLDGVDMVEQSRLVEDLTTWEDRILPVVVLASAWPSGPNLSLWVDESGPPYRVVTFDHEESADRYFTVVANDLGDALLKYARGNFDLFDVISSDEQFEAIDIKEATDLPDPEPPAEPSGGRARRPEETLEIAPSDLEPAELFTVFVDMAERRSSDIDRIMDWANALGASAVKENPELSEEREHFVRTGLAAAASHPRREEVISRFLKFRVGWPYGDSERKWTPMPEPESGWGPDST